MIFFPAMSKCIFPVASSICRTSEAFTQVYMLGSSPGVDRTSDSFMFPISQTECVGAMR